MNSTKEAYDLGFPRINTYKTAEIRKFEEELYEKALRDFDIFKEHLSAQKTKEELIMKVTYNGFTGELVKLEKYENDKAARRGGWPLYDLAIYDSEANVTHCFEDVKLEDVKFSGWVMTFGG